LPTSSYFGDIIILVSEESCLSLCEVGQEGLRKIFQAILPSFPTMTAGSDLRQVS